MRLLAAAEREDWDAMTATDSDDQADSGFFDQAYDDAMKMELKSEEAWKGRDMSNLYPSQSFPVDGKLQYSSPCKLCKESDVYKAMPMFGFLHDLLFTLGTPDF